MSDRFTRDGHPLLETWLRITCEKVRQAVTALFGDEKLEGLVLGGGYGRGEGGVLRETSAEKAYNDLEFYVFLKGNRVLNEMMYSDRLGTLSQTLSKRAQLHIEFKIESLERLRSNEPTVFSYDLVSGHKILHGPPHLFSGCNHHKLARRIPISEATRLLFNRLSGLMVARDLCRKAAISASDSDYIFRNLRKAQLALGDAVLVTRGAYHWSCLERNARLHQARRGERWMHRVVEFHDRGVAFKLAPVKVSAITDAARSELEEVIEVGERVWLWVEGRHWHFPFASARQYALSARDRRGNNSGWKNFLVSLRTFGIGAAVDAASWCYPRERLYDALALLLWADRPLSNSELRTHLQSRLNLPDPNWEQALSTYKKVWAAYG